MKRIAAIAALVVISALAIPTTALASTSTPGSGPGYARPGPASIVCLLPGHFRKGQVKFAVAAKGRLKAIEILRRYQHGKPVTIRIGCPDWRPAPRACPSQALRFDMASGSSTLTEVSGPMLTPPEQFGYDGRTYTIMSVNPGADSFTVFVNGALFVNKGPAITDGIALMSCSG
jgi:hypothetical protein